MSNSKYTSPYAQEQLKKVKKRNPEMYERIMEKARKGKRTATKNDGGNLKEVPSNNKGLSKLPAKVRNRMGYKQSGGEIVGRSSRGGTRGTRSQSQDAYEQQQDMMREFEKRAKEIEEANKMLTDTVENQGFGKARKR